MISVIVPVYNVEAYLRRCLDSIINQSYTDFELILVDDGSKDSSGRICDEYAQLDSRIQVIHQENQGLSAARNAGIEISTRKYITFVDSDDYILPDMLEHLLNTCVENDADMACACYDRVFEDGTRFKDYRSKAVKDVELYTGISKMEALLRHRRIPNSAWGKLYDRKIFDKIRFPVGKIYEDADVILEIVHSAHRIAVTNKLGYIYCIRSGSIMAQSFSTRNYFLIDIQLKDYTFITEHYPELTDLMYDRIIGAGMRLVYQSAVCKFRDPVLDKKLQSMLRRFMKDYLHNSSRRNIISRLAALNLNFARMVVRLLYPFRPNHFSWL